MLGAGGGGFLMLLADDRNGRHLREVMAGQGLREMPFSFDLEGAKVVMNI